MVAESEEVPQYKTLTEAMEAGDPVQFPPQVAAPDKRSQYVASSPDLADEARLYSEWVAEGDRIADAYRRGFEAGKLVAAPASVAAPDKRSSVELALPAAGTPKGEPTRAVKIYFDWTGEISAMEAAAQAEEAYASLTEIAQKHALAGRTDG